MTDAISTPARVPAGLAGVLAGVALGGCPLQGAVDAFEKACSKFSGG